MDQWSQILNIIGNLMKAKKQMTNTALNTYNHLCMELKWKLIRGGLIDMQNDTWAL